MPAPTAELLRRLRTTQLPAGEILHRGHQVLRPDPTVLVPGRGDSRFAPLDGVAHTYLARSTFAALLESAFHEAVPPEPRIYELELARWRESVVSLRHGLRLLDLRDGELERLGLARSELVATTATHYPCTRAWAQQLWGRRVGGQVTHGLIWHSRQFELHRLAMSDRPALREVMSYVGAEVLVLWSPPTSSAVLADVGRGLGLLEGDEGDRYVSDLADTFGITIL